MSIEYQNAITLDSSGKTKETNIAVKSGKLRIEVIRQDQHLRTYTPQHDTIRLATWKCGMENGLGCLHATQRKQFSHAQQLHWSQFASAPYEKPVVYVVGQTVKLLKIDSGCFKFPKCSKSIQISSKKTCTIIQSTISSATCQTCQLLVNACNFALADSPLFQDESNHPGSTWWFAAPLWVSSLVGWKRFSEITTTGLDWSTGLEMKDHRFSQKSR